MKYTLVDVSLYHGKVIDVQRVLINAASVHDHQERKKKMLKFFPCSSELAVDLGVRVFCWQHRHLFFFGFILS